MFAAPANSKGKTLTQTMKRQATLERNSVGVGVHKFDQLIRSQVPKPSAQSVAENKPPERRAALAERLQLVDYAAAAVAFHAPILAPAAADVDKIKVSYTSSLYFGNSFT